ncbi:unnamed protein product [Kuraishia capsulata CBS 1993]|uniref:NADP-dependent oxidoreductase domain-containing protein n=1 Tax=Kuraishia capsulata CBS 1993 TaxID=1382522 RepID=W6MWH4_9ASCO|nr:uncharacterized protein KUCA_T00003428001 [Kuraishia capsulata CBS 1993]CDK27450.1 unnamed protein product [Kuraishia capsulata CBS 1993]
MSLPKITSISIPSVGFGTGTKWFKFGRDDLDENLVSNLKLAISKGLTHIDGAEVYNTDLETGKAIEGLDRSKLWITDKYFAGDETYTAHSTYANPYESLKGSLKKLGTSYVDLYLLHAPFIKKESHGFDLKEAWQFLEKAKDEGLAKHIGVSNFEVSHLKTILEGAKHKVEVHQIEFNPFLQNQTPGVVEFSQKEGIVVEAYSPLGPLYKGDASNPAYKPFDAYLGELSAKYGRSKTQILLKWTQQRDIVPVTTSSRPERLDEFLKLSEFELTSEEVTKIKDLGLAYSPPLRQYWNPEFGKYD